MGVQGLGAAQVGIGEGERRCGIGGRATRRDGGPGADAR
jgi:hypothetical protein